MRQSKAPGLRSSNEISSALRDGLSISRAMSTGRFPLLSMISLLAFLYRRSLTGLVDSRVSELFTAKCKAVYPSSSLIDKSF